MDFDQSRMVVRVVVTERIAPNRVLAVKDINAADAFAQDLLDAGRVALNDVGATLRT